MDLLCASAHLRLPGGSESLAVTYAARPNQAVSHACQDHLCGRARPESPRIRQVREQVHSPMQGPVRPTPPIAHATTRTPFQPQPYAYLGYYKCPCTPML